MSPASGRVSRPYVPLDPFSVPPESIRASALQIEEMYSVPESFLEIEVRNPQTHGKQVFFAKISLHCSRCCARIWSENVYRL